jgi:hypothetical protein
MLKCQIKMSVNELETLVQHLKNRAEFGGMNPCVYVSIQSHPNGREYLEFEQPSPYSECNSECHRYEMD